LVAHHPPALVLLDDSIAGLTAPRLRAHISRRHRVGVPVITTTTNPSVAAALASDDSWSCLTKPFAIDDLLASVTHNALPARRDPVVSGGDGVS
jgi:DNA-binding NtrC family response regulator